MCWITGTSRYLQRRFAPININRHGQLPAICCSSRPRTGERLARVESKLNFTTIAAVMTVNESAGPVPNRDLPPRQFDLKFTPDQIAEHTTAIEAILRNGCDAVAAVPEERRTIKNTFLAFHAAQSQAAAQQAFCTLPALVHADAATRSAAGAAQVKLRQAFDSTYARRDVYQALECVTKQISAEHQHLYARTLYLFRINGMGIADEAKRAEFQRAKRELVVLEQEFTQAINEDVSQLEFTPEELAGCSASYLSSLPRAQDGANYLVSTKTPDYVAIMQAADVPATRRRMYLAYQSRCKDTNSMRLARMVLLRDKVARLAGFDSHAHLKLAGSMAERPENLDFLEDLARQLRGRRDSDLATLRDLKRNMTNDQNASLEAWDVSYYLTHLKKRDYQVDEELVSQYFPLERVLAGILDVYADLFELEFVPTPQMAKWHPDIRAYTVYRRSCASGSAGSEVSRGQLVGHFYLDLHPRPGKYAHQCVAPLMPATLNGGPNDSLTLPIAANLGNLTRPASDQPAQLKFSEVRTSLHEFGHVVHCLLSRSNTALGSWTWSLNPYAGGVEVDFLELPSQMFENWLYDERVLARLSAHVGTGAPLPSELAGRLRSLRRLAGGYAYTRQLFMSLFDLAIHSPGFSSNLLGGQDVDGDSDAAVKALSEKMRTTWTELQRRVNGTELVPETAPWASWYHLAGYDAAYYSYLYSEVFSFDCFAQFERAEPDGCLNADVARKYSETILSPGANLPGLTMLRAFLGRDPDNSPFLRHVLGDG